MKDMVVSIIGGFLLLLTILVIGGLFVSVMRNFSEVERFRQECVQVNGKPVYNGRNWECLR